MKLKTKLFLPVLTVIVLLGLSSTAFAQQSCGVASTPVSRDTSTGLTEVVGDLILNCVFGGTPSTTATMTVSYPVTITDSTTYPAGLVAPATLAAKTISITNLSGDFGAAAPGAPGCAPTISSVNNSSGQIVINIPAFGGATGCAAPPATTTGSFTLTGVLAALNGSGLTTMNANLSVSPGNNVLITAGQNVATVITTILPGIKDPTLTPFTAAATVLSSGSSPAAAGAFSVDISENYIDAYRSASLFNSGAATQATQLTLTFNNIATGVTLGGAGAAACTIAASATGGTTLVPAISATSITAAANTITVDFPNGTPPDLTKMEKVTFACPSLSIGGTATLPLTPAQITMTATLSPTGTALSGAGAVLVAATTGQIPRYAATQQPATPLVVINIVGAQTNILIPFATTSLSYDTGISIANTTADPFGGTAAGGARAQAGTVTFTFYPQTGTSCSFTTSTATPGVGLSSSGTVVSGGTYSVLLSQLLGAASGCSSLTTSFTGYIFAVANFTNGHGAAFVTNFKGFTSGENVLVLPPPIVTSRAAGALETLGH